MFDSAHDTWRRLMGRGESWLGRLRDRGLAESAKWARRLLGVAEPEAPDHWLEWERETLRTVLERMCRYPEWPEPEACGAFEETLDFLQTLPLGRRRQLHHLLAIVEAGSLATAPEGQRRRFSRLDPVAADAYLDTWAQSSLPPRRAVFQGLKSICMMGYWSRPETWSGIGYDLESNPGLDSDASSESS
jgi:hypothetical protein